MDTRERSCERVSEVMAEARTSLRCRKTIGSWTPTTILRTPSSPPCDLISLRPLRQELRQGECHWKFHCSHRDGIPRNGLPAFRTRHISRLWPPTCPPTVLFSENRTHTFCFEALRRRTSWSSASLLSDVISAKGVDQLDCAIFFFSFLSFSCARE